jgi:hypothetical protein
MAQDGMAQDGALGPDADAGNSDGALVAASP